MGTKNVSLPAELEEYIDAKVASGEYAHASEVVREGIRLMMERESAKLEWLRNAIAEGVWSAENEPLIPLDREAGPAVADEIVDAIGGTIWKKIARFPTAGRGRPEFGELVRSYPVPPYLVFCAASERRILVLRILHGRRDLRGPLMSLLLASA